MCGELWLAKLQMVYNREILVCLLARAKELTSFMLIICVLRDL